MLARNAGLVADVQRDHVGRRQRDGMDMDRKARRGDQRRVAGPQQGQAHVAESLLRADRGDDLLIGVEGDAEPRLVAAGDLAAQVVDAGRGAVAVVPRVAGGLAELVDDPLLGRIGGVAHPQVDHVDPVAPLAVLQLVDPAEEIRRQAADPGRDLEVVSSRSTRVPRNRDWSWARSCSLSRGSDRLPQPRRTDQRRSVGAIGTSSCRRASARELSAPSSLSNIPPRSATSGPVGTARESIARVGMLKCSGYEDGSGTANGCVQRFYAMFAGGGVDTRCTTRRPNRPRNHPLLDRPHGSGSIWIIIKKGRPGHMSGPPLLASWSPPRFAATRVGRRRARADGVTSRSWTG